MAAEVRVNYMQCLWVVCSIPQVFLDGSVQLLVMALTGESEQSPQALPPGLVAIMK